MTDFDRAVLRWLNDASVTDRARTVTLGRTLVGIQSYAELIRGDDSTAAIPVDAIRLDINLKDTVARAQRRVEDGQPLELGELPPPPPAPQTLLSARSSTTTGPNLRRVGGGSKQSAQHRDPRSNSNAQFSRDPSQAQSQGGQQQVPLSARSGPLASARSSQPARPTQVPALKLGAKKAGGK